MTTNRPRIIEAIRSLGLRVTAADVAAVTGMPLNAVIRELNKVAADTQAVLEVSNVGTIAYVFGSDPGAAYQAQGLRKAMLQLLAVARNVVFFVVRCSFGLLLIGSILTLLVVFVIAIAFAMFAADASDGDLGDVDIDGADLNFNFFDVLNLTMFFTWWRNDLQGEVTYYGQKIEVRETGFISNCFSFLFGDGDPNRDFAEAAWKIVADIIRLNNGVITAEQVGPYFADYATDSTIFPVLVHFDGIPEVTNSGNIVYVFPSMQSTAAGHVFWKIPQFAEAKQWKFSTVPTKRLDFVFYFAGANLAGWYAVAGSLHSFEFMAPYKGIVDGLLAYAIFFIAFPILRSLFNAVRNAVVEIQNKHRQKNLELLVQPQVLVKMQEAQSFAQAMQWHDPRGLAYTTAKDVIEQEAEPY